MLTLKSILKTARQAASYGDGKHYFAGGPHALRTPTDGGSKNNSTAKSAEESGDNDDGQPDKG